MKIEADLVYYIASPGLVSGLELSSSRLLNARKAEKWNDTPQLFYFMTWHEWNDGMLMNVYGPWLHTYYTQRGTCRN